MKNQSDIYLAFDKLAKESIDISDRLIAIRAEVHELKEENKELQKKYDKAMDMLIRDII